MSCVCDRAATAVLSGALSSVRALCCADVHSDSAQCSSESAHDPHCAPARLRDDNLLTACTHTAVRRALCIAVQRLSLGQICMHSSSASACSVAHIQAHSASTSARTENQCSLHTVARRPILNLRANQELRPLVDICRLLYTVLPCISMGTNSRSSMLLCVCMDCMHIGNCGMEKSVAAG